MDALARFQTTVRSASPGPARPMRSTRTSHASGDAAELEHRVRGFRLLEDDDPDDVAPVLHGTSFIVAS